MRRVGRARAIPRQLIHRRAAPAHGHDAPASRADAPVRVHLLCMTLPPFPPGQGPEGAEIAQTPHNLEAEQALLGALLYDNAAYERLSDSFQPNHFYEP